MKLAYDLNNLRIVYNILVSQAVDPPEYMEGDAQAPSRVVDRDPARPPQTSNQPMAASECLFDADQSSSE